MPRKDTLDKLLSKSSINLGDAEPLARQPCCCKRYRPFAWLWSPNPKIRWSARVALLLMVTYASYCLMMGLTMIPLLSCLGPNQECFVVTEMALSDLCAYTPELALSASLDYSPWVSVKFGEITVTAKQASTGALLATSNFTPQFTMDGSSSSSNTVKYGKNYVKAVSLPSTLASPMAQVMNELQLHSAVGFTLHVSGDLTISAFTGFPVTVNLPMDLNAACVMKDSNYMCRLGTVDEVKALPFKPVTGDLTDPELKSLTMGSPDPSTLVSTASLTVDLGDVPMRLGVGPLSLDLFSVPAPLATPRTTRFNNSGVESSVASLQTHQAVIHGNKLGGRFNFTASVMAQAGEYRTPKVVALTNAFLNGDALHLYLQGGANASTGECFMQDVLNEMLPMPVPIPSSFDPSKNGGMALSKVFNTDFVNLLEVNDTTVKFETQISLNTEIKFSGSIDSADVVILSGPSQAKLASVSFPCLNFSGSNSEGRPTAGGLMVAQLLDYKALSELLNTTIRQLSNNQSSGDFLKSLQLTITGSQEEVASGALIPAIVAGLNFSADKLVNLTSSFKSLVDVDIQTNNTHVVAQISAKLTNFPLQNTTVNTPGPMHLGLFQYSTNRSSICHEMLVGQPGKEAPALKVPINQSCPHPLMAMLVQQIAIDGRQEENVVEATVVITQDPSYAVIIANGQKPSNDYSRAFASVLIELILSYHDVVMIRGSLATQDGSAAPVALTMSSLTMQALAKGMPFNLKIDDGEGDIDPTDESETFRRLAKKVMSMIDRIDIPKFTANDPFAPSFNVGCLIDETKATTPGYPGRDCSKQSITDVLITMGSLILVNLEKVFGQAVSDVVRIRVSVPEIKIHTEVRRNTTDPKDPDREYIPFMTLTIPGLTVDTKNGSISVYNEARVVNIQNLTDFILANFTRTGFAGGSNWSSILANMTVRVSGDTGSMLSELVPTIEVSVLDALSGGGVDINGVGQALFHFDFKEHSPVDGGSFQLILDQKWLEKSPFSFPVYMDEFTLEVAVTMDGLGGPQKIGTFYCPNVALMPNASHEITPIVTITSQQGISLTTALSNFINKANSMSLLVSGGFGMDRTMLSLNAWLPKEVLSDPKDVWHNFVQSAVNDKSCEGDMCFFNGFVTVYGVYPMGGTAIGEPISCPCIFPGLCPTQTPLQIQSIPPSFLIVHIQLRLSFLDGIPIRILTSVPGLSLDMSLDKRKGIAGIVVDPFTFDNTDKTPLTIKLQFRVQDWWTVYQLLDLTERKEPLAFAAYSLAKPGSNTMGSLIPTLKVQIAASDFAMDSIAFPMPYYSKPGEPYYQPWMLTGTTANSASFLIMIKAFNPMPTRFTLKGLTGDLMYTDEAKTTSKVMDVSVPGGDLKVEYGNITVSADAKLVDAAPTCYNANCFPASAGDPLKCVPCQSSKFLRSFLAKEPTKLGIRARFITYLGGTVSFNMDMLLYEDPATVTSPSRAKSLVPDVDFGSVFARMIIFKVNVGETILASLGSIIGNFAIKPVLGLDVNVFNIMNFQMGVARFRAVMYLKDVDGYGTLAPLHDMVALGRKPLDPYLKILIVDWFSQDTNVVLAPNETSKMQVVDVPMTDLDATGRALDELNAKNQLCVDAEQGLMEMSMICRDADLAPHKLKCTSTVPFQMSMPFNIKGLDMFKRHACHQPPDCQAKLATLFTQQTAQFTTVGSAVVQSGGLKLTTGTDQMGALYVTAQQRVRKSWTTSFNFQIVQTATCWNPLGCQDDSGFAFVIQNQKPDALGTNCDALTSIEGVDDSYFLGAISFATYIKCLGYQGITNSVGILFSTKYSKMTVVGDSSKQSVSVWTNGFIPAENRVPDGALRASAQLVGERKHWDGATQGPATCEKDLDDGMHSVVIRYSDVYKMVYVYLDDMVSPLLYANVDMADIELGGPNKAQAWAGFTGATGGHREEIVITNWVLSRDAPSLPLTKIVEEDQNLAVVGDEGSFTLDTRDSCDFPMTGGNDAWHVTVMSEATGLKTEISSSAVIDQGDGTYEVSFALTQAGRYAVIVNYDGSGVADFTAGHFKVTNPT